MTTDDVMNVLWHGGWLALVVGVALWLGIGPALVLLGAHMLATYGMLLSRPA